MKHGGKLLGLAASAAVLIALARLQPRTARVSEAPTDRAAALEAAPPAERAAVVVAPSAEEPTVGQALERYWGERWPEVREELVEEGADLDAPFHLVPWEEASDAIAREMLAVRPDTKQKLVDSYRRWPEPTTYEFLAEEFHLPASFTPSHLHEVESLIAPLNDELDSLSGDYVDQLSLALTWLWSRGKFVKAPYSTTGAPSPYGADTFYSTSLGSGTGWAVTIALERSEFPELIELRDRMSGLRRQREGTLNRYFSEFQR